MLKTVPMSDYAIVRAEAPGLATFALGSCLGVVALDPILGIAGLLHAMLPLCTIDRELARVRPCMFVDTGTQHLLNELLEKGAARENLILAVAGGGSLLDDGAAVRIGPRNLAVLEQVADHWSVPLVARAVGGHHGRNMSILVRDRTVVVKCAGAETILLRWTREGVEVPA